jgi:hypothetical protein
VRPADLPSADSFGSRVENQSATVDAVARMASDAGRLSEQVSMQTAEAAMKLGQLNTVIAAANSALIKVEARREFQKYRSRSPS